MLQTKAIYNLIRLSIRQDPTIQVEAWAVEDLRSLQEEKLWERLEELEVRVNHEAFSRYAEECETPEELADLLVGEEAEAEYYDQVYLVLFELWRRLLPDRSSLSIFCDELDYQIEQLEVGVEMVSPTAIPQLLWGLRDVLQEHVQTGTDPSEGFEEVAQYSAHHLEGFLYDFVDQLIELGEREEATRLIAAFIPYLPEPAWFDLLEARLIYSEDPKEGRKHYSKLLKEEIPLDPLFELSYGLLSLEEKNLFSEAMKKLLVGLETEDDLEEAIELAVDYFRHQGDELNAQAVQKIRSQRKQRAPELAPADPDLASLQKLFQ